MNSGNKDKQPVSDEAALNIIVDLSRRRNRKALREFFSQGDSVGHRVNGMTAVEKLAMECDVDAVRFLLDYFCASLNCAARGYARAGNVEQVEALLNMGASMDFALEGYAISELDDHVYDLINRGAKIEHAIYGYAQVNAIDKLKNLDRFEKEIIDKYTTSVEIFTQYDNIQDAWHAGFAKAGNITMLDALNEKTEGVVHHWITIYAEAGLFNYVDELVARSGDRERAIRCAVAGYAMGGHREKVEELLLLGADICDTISSYAKAGMVRHAVDLIKRCDDKELAYLYLITGLMDAGLVSKVDEYFQLCVREFKWFSKLNKYDVDNYFPEYRYCKEARSIYSDDRVCLRLLSFTNYLKMRQMIVKSLEDHCANHHGKYQLLAKKAHAINRWMNEYDLGYSCALKLISLTESERVWCLQGSQTTRKRDENNTATQPLPIISYEVFLSITSQMLGLSIKNTELVIAALHERVMAESIKRNASKFESGFFSNQQLIEENKKSNDKFHSVLRFN